MYKKISLLIVLPVLLILSGCGSKLPIITQTAKNTNYDFPVGQQFKIVLPSNQTTGYKWEVQDITAGALTLVKQEYKVIKNKTKENLVGQGGEEILTFKVTEVKRSHIVLEYRRPWDKTSVTNNFLVTINGNPGDDGLLTFTGKIKSTPTGAQFDDYFVSSEGDSFGISPLIINKIADPGVVAKIKEFKDKNQELEIRGSFTEDVPDYNGRQFVISEIKAIN